jgi:putative radical SAM enzyme (TIGR03279 family)
MYEFAVAPAVSQIRRRGVEISGVAPLSIGDEMELEPGDRIIKVNGRVVRDYLDFRFHSAGETELVLEVKKRSGEDWELQIERSEGEDLGLSFEQIVPRQCANECIFCFCNGNPADARPSLFIKDEDIRLSFLYGNYTTLTSLSNDELKRIIEQRLSPQYVSVHATDLDVRAYLLGVSQERADITSRFKQLLDAGIEIHAQVVLCPNINDGDVLKRTIEDLAREYPRVSSVAIVPLGLTRYNTDPRLTAVTSEFCKNVIAELLPTQRAFRKKLGTTFAFLGDEIYLKAGMKVPSRAHYGNYPQIEDGIGMVRSFENSFDRLIKSFERSPLRNAERLNGTILTGELFAPVLRKRIDQLNDQYGSRLRVCGVANKYFGGDVSVAGLLTGGDLLSALDHVEGDFIVIPKSVLKSDEQIMLDGMTLEQLEAQMGRPVYPIDTEGLQSFLREATTVPRAVATGSSFKYQSSHC